MISAEARQKLFKDPTPEVLWLGIVQTFGRSARKSAESDASRKAVNTGFRAELVLQLTRKSGAGRCTIASS
jgi:hypothetical protein